MMSDLFILLFVFSVLLISGILYFRFARSTLDVVSFYVYFLIYQILLVLLFKLAGVRYDNALVADIDLPYAMLKVNLLFLVFHAGVLVGYLGVKRTPAILRILYPRLPNRQDTLDRTFSALRVISAGVVILTAAIVVQSGGFLEALHAIRKGRIFSGHTYAVILYILGIYTSASLSAWILLDKELKPEERKKRLRQSLFLFAVNLMCVMILGDRDLLLGPTFVLLIFWIRSRLKHVALHTGFIFLLLGAGLAVLGIVRQRTLLQTSDTPSTAFGRCIQQFVPIKPFNASLSMAYLTDSPEAYANLEDYYKGILSVIPRSLWKDKPQIISYGIRIRNLLKGTREDTAGWPVLSPVLAFINGGYLFTILTGICTGILLKYAMIRYSDHLRNPYSLMMIVILSIKILGGGIRPSIFSNTIQYLIPFSLLGILLSWSPRFHISRKTAESLRTS